MDSFYFHNVKTEKVKAMKKYNRLQSIAKVFRIFEVLSALLFLAWTAERVPFAIKISGEFVLKLGGIIASPFFVFLICNLIIITLIAKSGIFSALRNADSKVCEEIIIKTADTHSKSVSQEEIVYQDKEIISEVNTSTRKCEDMEPELEPESDSDFEADNPRVYRRSKSEKLEREKVKKELRRSESEKKCRKIENMDEKLFPEDDLSNEEFQRAIEDFIAKQLRFRREESLSIVLQSQA
ncbi:hypothetical protein GOBAR_AA10511 [Gossypium barbadense]|uniref:DUF4408 domain-containing protein n=1 Tax=Gossypium barbadense TaxID=3634 RepID=A0A2P5Y3F5_GOSBA|nr:hypothetical protein GOBAR_AA10511 [Gossypium barbadense]